MLCFDIFLNGEHKYIAGHEQMEQMRASLYLTTDGPRLFVVDANFKSADTLTQDAFWPTLEPKIGDVITIQIVQSNSPDSPSRLVRRGSLEDKLGNKILYCSICGRSHKEAKKFITSKEVNVCDECFGTLAAYFNEA